MVDNRKEAHKVSVPEVHYKVHK